MKRKRPRRAEPAADTRFAQVAALTPPPGEMVTSSSMESAFEGAPASASQDDGTSATRMMPAVDAGLEQFPLAMPLQSLLHDTLLQEVQRVTFHDQLVPLLGGILLTAQIGKGGMGSVYYGVHTRLRIGVAVKLLDPNLVLRHPELVARFHREAQLAARVRSRHLVGVIDVNRESGLDFIVMEFVVGLSAEGALLEAFRNKKVGLSERAVLELGLAAARGLGDAHAAGVVHRDMKPANLLIPRSPGEREPRYLEAKIADLGIAKLDGQDHGLTATSATMGTLGYLAPEQARDARSVGKPADVFGLGATLYALLAGRPPMRGVTVNEALRASLEALHLPLGSEVPGLFPETVETIERCLRKDPDERFPDGLALAQALLACLGRLDEAGTGYQAAERGVAKPETPIPAEPTPAPVRVLTIDDDATTSRLLRHFLESLPWPVEIVQAASADEAKTCIARAMPEIVITDVCLGRTDGYEMIEWIRAQPGMTLTPVIAVSGIPQEIGQTRCLMVGADAYLAKPVAREALGNVMARMLIRVRPGGDRQKA